jgi:hypothetical protein
MRRSNFRIIVSDTGLAPRTLSASAARIIKRFVL